MEIAQKKSSLGQDGLREKIRIADVAGYFTTRRHLFFIGLIAIYAVLPWLKINGYPVLFLDVLHRRFYLFGHTFNAQDFYLVFILFTGVLFSLFFITALVGRVWCGWACPQTVFLEGVFRRIERWVEGPRQEQIRLAALPWNREKAGKFLLKHFLYILCALAVSHIFISYFVSLEHLFEFMRRNPREHWEAFVWMLSITGVIYFNFAWFREQLCLIVCPYGKAQSFLIDDDSLVIGYDSVRGEPRGKKGMSGAGDCISCNRCVDVCPTGIDIRNGLQLECIGCANCVDACNAVMSKVGRPLGLIRYDSHNGLFQKVRRILRPRVFLYFAFMLLWVGIALALIQHRKPFEANILRLTQAPYELEHDLIRNQYKIHLFNKRTTPAIFSVHLVTPGFKIIIPFATVELGNFEDRQIPFFVETEEDSFEGNKEITFHIVNETTKEEREVKTMFLGPATPF